MSNEDRQTVRLAIEVSDQVLADRIATLLGGVPGLELVTEADPSDVTVVVSAERRASEDAGQALTARELEVLALLTEGASNKLIARRLGISMHTAKFHVGSVLDKLDAVSRTDAVTHALRLGLIEL